ncbi:MAG TPA: DUF1499 domain-containing protein [Nitrospiria bacterium]|jgi:uncharacterized protein (DUF1499 family)|nr:DUF1499 domain-containing protein [Nitrospiria bacterium]
MNNPETLKRTASAIAPVGFGLAVLTASSVMLAGLGSRWGWWTFRTGFTLLQWGFYVGLAAAAFSIIGLAAAWSSPTRRVLFPALSGLIIAVVVVGTLWSWKLTAQRVPPIHDITTDTENPPSFVAILPLRANAPNPAAYGGPEIAAQQRAGYPNLRPLILPVPPAQGFKRALAVARNMGWQIIDSNPSEGRIEATDTTFWFGFKDDIVVRVRPAQKGSRIDVRSVSRVGRSDVGTNAKRIQNFLQGMTLRK